MKTSKSQSGLWIVALLTGLVGIIDLISAVTPGLPNCLAIFKDINLVQFENWSFE